MVAALCVNFTVARVSLRQFILSKAQKKAVPHLYYPLATSLKLAGCMTT